ncbi:hypothetical protein D3C71_1079490 [compost metagenome]
MGQPDLARVLEQPGVAGARLAVLIIGVAAQYAPRPVGGGRDRQAFIRQQPAPVGQAGAFIGGHRLVHGQAGHIAAQDIARGVVLRHRPGSVVQQAGRAHLEHPACRIVAEGGRRAADRGRGHLVQAVIGVRAHERAGDVLTGVIGHGRAADRSHLVLAVVDIAGRADRRRIGVGGIGHRPADDLARRVVGEGQAEVVGRARQVVAQAGQPTGGVIAPGR